jgi:hypothetical protein
MPISTPFVFKLLVILSFLDTSFLLLHTIIDTNIYLDAQQNECIHKNQDDK